MHINITHKDNHSFKIVSNAKISKYNHIYNRHIYVLCFIILIILCYICTYSIWILYNQHDILRSKAIIYTVGNFIISGILIFICSRIIKNCTEYNCNYYEIDNIYKQNHSFYKTTLYNISKIYNRNIYIQDRKSVV